MKSLNFNQINKTYMTITLPDEDNTKLLIMTPTKSIIDKLMSMEEFISGVEEVGAGVLDDLYDVCAEIMNRNKAGRKITAQFLAEILDFEDLVIFFNSYMEYVSEISNLKN